MDAKPLISILLIGKIVLSETWKIAKKTLERTEKLSALGFEVLIRELGPEGPIRFIQQYETGQGDYSRDRKKLAEEVCTRNWRGDDQTTAIKSKITKMFSLLDKIAEKNKV